MKELKMFIDGRFIENESGKWIKVLNPSTEEVISLMPDGGRLKMPEKRSMPQRKRRINGKEHPL